MQRELLFLAIGLVLGLLVVPPVIWFGGTLVLGPYADGGLSSLLSNFFKALASGAPAFWAVALGPYGLILLARLLVYALRSAPHGASEREPQARRPAPPAAPRRPVAEPKRPAPQVRRAPPTQEQRRPAQQPQANVRRTPYIKSLDIKSLD